VPVCSSVRKSTNSYIGAGPILGLAPFFRRLRAAVESVSGLWRCYPPLSSPASSTTELIRCFSEFPSLSSFDHYETGGTAITKTDRQEEGRPKMLGTILIVILILALIGALPRWSHSREWGYAPTGGLGVVLFVVVILLVLGRI